MWGFPQCSCEESLGGVSSNIDKTSWAQIYQHNGERIAKIVAVMMVQSQGPKKWYTYGNGLGHLPCTWAHWWGCSASPSPASMTWHFRKSGRQTIYLPDQTCNPSTLDDINSESCSLMHFKPQHVKKTQCWWHFCLTGIPFAVIEEHPLPKQTKTGASKNYVGVYLWPTCSPWANYVAWIRGFCCLNVEVVQVSVRIRIDWKISYGIASMITNIPALKAI